MPGKTSWKGEENAGRHEAILVIQPLHASVQRQPADVPGNQKFERVHICMQNSPERDHNASVFIHDRLLASRTYPVLREQCLCALGFRGEIACHGVVVKVVA